MKRPGHALYALFTTESLSNQLLAISKVLKACVDSSLSLNSVLTSERGAKSEGKLLEAVRKEVRRCVISSLWNWRAKWER